MTKKLTLDDLRKLREEKQREMSRRGTAGSAVEVIVGMGTCGIAAGAKATFDALVANLKAQGLESVQVKQTGCMGLCYSEPTVEVIVPGMPTIIYGEADPALAHKIVMEHIVGGHLLDDHIYDRPSADLVAEMQADRK